MSGKSVLLSVFLVVLTQFAVSVFALKCYQCDGPKGQSNDCEVNLTNANQMECSLGFYCISAIITTGNNSVIHRSCGASNECEGIAAHQYHTTDKSDLICTACNENDLCNSTNRLSSDTHILMFIFGAFVILLSNFLSNNSS